SRSPKRPRTSPRTSRTRAVGTPARSAGSTPTGTPSSSWRCAAGWCAARRRGSTRAAASSKARCPKPSGTRPSSSSARSSRRSAPKRGRGRRMTKPANLLTVWAELLIDTLASNGATDVVISPGSRSTPFAIAAARNERLRAHVVIDERAAGFYSLRLARVIGAPPLLVCTSGTAPAHYFPAVIEASESGLPLLVLSANRPRPLSARGAPLPIHQTRLFGSHARFFADLGEPDPSPSALHALRRTAARAIAESRGPLPGPVHLNARAAKPLEPREASTDEERALASLARSVPEVSIPPATLTHDAALLERIAERIERAERPAIVAGPLPLDAPRGAIAALARSRGIALFAQASSQLRLPQ